ncbi:MAG: hypothetical protein MJ124_07565 [Lachnospiraceae bacterium]|nr:hypothetical protein [Lachnospiraceae bacterium]
MAATYKFRGYTFNSEKELNEAKKEAEAIDYLKSKTNLEDDEIALKLYNKLIERHMISTPVGLDFLKDIRAKVLKSGIVTEKNLKPLPDITKPKRSLKKKKETTQVAVLTRQNTYLKITIFVLCLIIIGMFIIVLTGKLSPIRTVYEQQIQNEYSSWKQELIEKEKKVNDKIYFLEQQGIYFDESENTDTTENVHQ